MSQNLFLLLLPLVILSWYSRPWALLVLLAMLPAYIIRLDIWGLPTTWLEMGIYLVAAIWLLKEDWRVWQKINFKVIFPWLLPLFLWLAAGVIGFLIASDTRLALGVWKGFIINPMLLSFMVATVALANKVEQLHWWRRVLGALMVGAIGTTILALAQTWLTGAVRLQSGYDSPNVLAMYLAPIAVAGWLWWFKDYRNMAWKWRYWWLAGCSLVLLGVFLTDSYTAMVAVGVALLVAWFIKKVPQLAVTIAMLLLVFTLAMPFLAVHWNKSLLLGHTNTTYGVTSGEVRLVLWRQAVVFIKERPLFGLGLGQWQAEFNLKATEQGWLSIKNPGLAIELYYSSLYPHNLWLTTWLATGLLGLAALFWLVIKVFMVARSAAVIPAAVLSVQIMHGALDTPMWKNDLAVLWWLVVAGALVWQLNLKSSD